MVIKAVRQNVVIRRGKEAPYEYEELQRCSVEKVIKGK
jgi:hypothetical protein